MGDMENVFGLMTTKLGRMASRAFEPDTPKILKVDFGKIKGQLSNGGNNGGPLL